MTVITAPMTQAQVEQALSALEVRSLFRVLA